MYCDAHIVGASYVILTEADRAYLKMLEECESGRIGTIGNRVTCKGPWVQIPPPPLHSPW